MRTRISRSILTLTLPLCLLGLAVVTVRASHPAVPQASESDVAISEIAWMGTRTSYYDEWIELYNNTASPIDLIGWRSRTSSTTGNAARNRTSTSRSAMMTTTRFSSLDGHYGAMRNTCSRFRAT